MPIENLTVVNVSPDARIYNNRPFGVEISAIVLHHTGGTNSLRWLSTYHAGPVSIHRLVPKVMPDGRPGHYQIVSDNKRAWHAGDSLFAGKQDWGNFSLGIEVENRGLGVDVDPYTPEQYECVAQIVAYNCARYHIGDYWVRHHKEICVPPGRKTDMVGWDDGRMWQRVLEIRQDWPYPIPMWACMR